MDKFVVQREAPPEVADNGAIRMGDGAIEAQHFGEYKEPVWRDAIPQEKTKK